MRSWIAVAEVAAAGAVYLDARRLGIAYGGPSGRDGSLGAPGWALVTLILAPIAVPAYLWRRRRYRGAGRAVGSGRPA